jgi:hypothetical protein
MNTLDAQTIAVDAGAARSSGAPSWATSSWARPSPWRRWWSRTRCWSATAAANGRARLAHGARHRHRQDRLARLQHRTGQRGADRPGFKPFYAGPRQGPGREELAAGGLEDRRRHGLGLDLLRPELDLIYYGTGNPGPWNPSSGPATTSGPPASSRAGRTPARRSGSTSSPHDLHDYDGVNENVLLDLDMAGPAPQGAGASRPQRLRVCDRPRDRPGAVGHTLRHITTSVWRRPADRALATTRKETRMGEMTRDICPASPGGKDWQPSAWSPRTRCCTCRTRTCARTPTTFQASYIAGTPYRRAPTW